MSRKIYSNDFLQTIHNNSFLDVFSDKIIVCYRNIDRSPNLIGQFQVLELILSMKNNSKDFLQIRYINFFLDVLSNELVVCCRKTDGFPNLVILFLVSEVFASEKKKDKERSRNQFLRFQRNLKVIVILNSKFSLTSCYFQKNSFLPVNSLFALVMLQCFAFFGNDYIGETQGLERLLAQNFM